MPPLVRDVMARMHDAGLDDEKLLRDAGVAGVYTPKDFELNRIMADIVRIVDAGTAKAA